MDIHLFMVFACLSALFSSVIPQTCEQSHYERCVKQLFEFTSKGDMVYASTAQELQQECVQAQSSLGCLTRYSKKCLPLEERTTFLNGISGPQKVTLGLCTDETDLKLRYIESLPCLRNMSEGLEYCNSKYDRNQKDIALVEYEDKIHLQCCSFDGYRRCLRMLMQTQAECREGTAEVVDEIASRLGGMFSDGVCTDYFERCTGTSSAFLQRALSISSLLLTSFACGRFLKFL